MIQQTRPLDIFFVATAACGTKISDDIFPSSLEASRQIFGRAPPSRQLWGFVRGHPPVHAIERAAKLAAQPAGCQRVGDNGRQPRGQEPDQRAYYKLCEARNGQSATIYVLYNIDVAYPRCVAAKAPAHKFARLTPHATALQVWRLRPLRLIDVGFVVVERHFLKAGRDGWGSAGPILSPL